MSTTRGRRRSGGEDTRAAIVVVARQQFAARGYTATTFRSVATAAGVDPALVVHFHGDKAGLFRSALALPTDPAPLVQALLDGPRRSIGRRLMERFLALAGDPASHAVLLGRLRCAASEPEAAALVRAMIADDVVAPVIRGLGVDRPQLRSALVSVQLIGWGMTRWIVEAEPLQRLDDDDVVEILGPVLQRLMLRPLPA